MSKVIVEVRGGAVQEVYTDEAFLDVVVVDWDNLQDTGREDTSELWQPTPITNLPAETLKILTDVGLM